jgi:hypothetical protein
MKITPGSVVNVSLVSDDPTTPPLAFQWKPTPPAGSSKVSLTVTIRSPDDSLEQHTFTLDVVPFTAGAKSSPVAATPAASAQPRLAAAAGAFQDDLLVFSDAGDKQNITVKNGPLTTQVAMADIDAFISGSTLPNIANNIAARLSLAGYTSVQSSPGVANTAALSTLNSVSFKSVVP